MNNIVTQNLPYTWKISNTTPGIVLARMKMVRIYLWRKSLLCYNCEKTVEVNILNNSYIVNLTQAFG